MRTNYPLHDGYVWEKLYDGLITIAGGEGSVTERLALAYDYHFRLLESSEISDLLIPPNLSAEIQGILGRLRQSFFKPSDYQWDLRNVDETKAKELVSELILVYGKVCSLLPKDHVVVAPREQDDE